MTDCCLCFFRVDRSFHPCAHSGWRCMAKLPWCFCSVHLCLVVCDHRARLTTLYEAPAWALVVLDVDGWKCQVNVESTHAHLHPTKPVTKPVSVPIFHREMSSVATSYEPEMRHAMPTAMSTRGEKTHASQHTRLIAEKNCKTEIPKIQIRK